MSDETKSGMQCAEFDALLAEAIDGTLNGERRERFEQHQASCAACNTLFAEVTNGLAWLDEVEDVPPPRNLVHNILAATSGTTREAARAMAGPSAWERLRRQVRMVFAPVLTPRFAMSMGMAFFSITLVLNMAQIRITDLTPSNLSHTFYSSQNKFQNKFMKYYENMRLVYEIESRVRDLRNATDESEREEKGRHHEKNKNQTQEQNQNSGPDQRQHREFSCGQNAQWMASLNEEQHLETYLAKQRRAI